VWAEDSKIKANLASQCATKSKEWDARQKLRAREVEAINETVEMLNGDNLQEEVGLSLLFCPVGCSDAFAATPSLVDTSLCDVITNLI